MDPMTRTFAIIIIAMLYNVCYSQGFKEHIVQRGETLKYLAEKYGVSENDIIEQNEDFSSDEFFVGLPLQIPIPEKQTAYIPVSMSQQNEADALYRMGSYRKAIKIYSSEIKQDPKADLYFFRGRCYLMQGKYKSAIRDLETASNRTDLSASNKSSCLTLLSEAQEKRQEQLENRANAWGAFFAAAAVTTAAVVQASTQQDAASQNQGTGNWQSAGYGSRSTSISSSSSGSSGEVHQCRVCGGTGQEVRDQYGGGHISKYCSICDKTVYTIHTHSTCTSCKGKGYW